MTKTHRDFLAERRRQDMPIPDPARWIGYAGRLAKRGIDPKHVKGLLSKASVRRRAYEDALENIVRVCADESYVRKVRARARRAERMRGRTIRFLKEAADLPKQFLDELDYRLRRHREGILGVLSLPTLMPRHRPSEVWLNGPVAQLVALFHGKTSRRFMISYIHKGLELFGHADVVKLEAVRHIIRKLRKSSPARSS